MWSSLSRNLGAEESWHRHDRPIPATRRYSRSRRLLRHQVPTSTLPSSPYLAHSLFLTLLHSLDTERDTMIGISNDTVRSHHGVEKSRHYWVRARHLRDSNMILTPPSLQSLSPSLNKFFHSHPTACQPTTRKPSKNAYKRPRAHCRKCR